MTIFKKTLFLLITMLSFSFFNNVYWEWETCEYFSQIDRCMSAQENWSQKSIEDFVCINWNRAKVSYQIILDMEFKKIDDKMDLTLTKLEENKNTYFWINADKSYIDWINYIHDKWAEFGKEYSELCSSIILEKAISCSNKDKSNQSVPISEAIKYFDNNWASCKDLINKKISIFKDVAFWVLMLNKLQIKADEKKTYDQTQRWNYDHLLDIMMINLWYIERIWQKWPSKLANPMK